MYCCGAYCSSTKIWTHCISSHIFHYFLLAMLQNNYYGWFWPAFKSATTIYNRLPAQNPLKSPLGDFWDLAPPFLGIFRHTEYYGNLAFVENNHVLHLMHRAPFWEWWILQCRIVSGITNLCNVLCITPDWPSWTRNKAYHFNN